MYIQYLQNGRRECECVFGEHIGVVKGRNIEMRVGSILYVRCDAYGQTRSLDSSVHRRAPSSRCVRRDTTRSRLSAEFQTNGKRNLLRLFVYSVLQSALARRRRPSPGSVARNKQRHSRVTHNTHTTHPHSGSLRGPGPTVCRRIKKHKHTARSQLSRAHAVIADARS